MASPTIKRGKNRSSGQTFSVTTVSLLPRRCAAWIMEVYLVAMSGIVPYSIGAYIESHSHSQKVPLQPVLASLEEGIAQTLALPQSQTQPRQVPPLTNLFWGLALGTPIAVIGWQLYILGRTGRTLPKRWLGVKVVTTGGRSPSGLQILLREGVGKWGLPLSVAYVLWRYSPVFPSGGGLILLSGVMVLLEGGLLLLSPRRRCFHDQIANTVVIDTKQGYKKRSSRPSSPSVTVEVPLNTPNYSQKQRRNPSPEPVRTLVLRPTIEKQSPNLWLWMRRHPGTTLLIISLAGITLILATFVGTQVYIEKKADQRQSEQQKNQEYQFLVTQLAATSADPLQERKAVILALARLEDPRSITLLVDLLGQETNLSIITTLEQAFASVGTKALPALRQQNQSLSQQLQAIEDQTSPDYQLTAWRLRATKQAIAKILVLHNNQLNQVNLSRVDLNKDIIEIAPFTLIAEELDLSGINFENAQLSQARLKGSVFASAGQDKHEDTFDDLIANFKGANLTQADLSEAVLPHVSLVGASLQQANLKRANLKQANLQKANLSSVQLLQANLQQANLKSASLTGADLTEAQFNQANLEQTNLGQINAVGANFSEANLAKSNWQDSDLSGVNFTSANLEQTDLSSTVLKGVNFRNAQLNNANLTDANLSQADLSSANLAGANFQGVIFSKVQFTNTNGFLKTPPNHQSEAIIKGVDFSEVKNLNPTQMDFICQKGGIHPQCMPKGS